jgi:two-component system chemotaxis response regulator CheB
LAPLPADFAGSIVVLIHRPPDQPSHLAEVIRRRCALPVVEADHGLPLLPGQVVVVPRGRHLLITPDDRVPATALIISGTCPSADLLLTTLATSVGPRAVAVILSGGGADGATGASAVHVCGGTVLATDETSSLHYSMPLAAIERDQAVDQILPLDRIAPVLMELAGARLRAGASA